MQTPLDPAAKKAYEVGYGLFRVAAVLGSRSFAQMLEGEALGLLQAAIGNQPIAAQKSIRTIGYLVAFGKDTGNVHPDNADLLIQQLEVLSCLLQDRNDNAVSPADIDRLFSVAGSEMGQKAEVSIVGEKEPNKRTEPLPSLMPGLKDRQTAILEKIRQSGNCRTRDLQAAFPEISERTLRYDLQRLVEEARIERGGGGGPASWYRVKPEFIESNISQNPSL